MSKSYTIIVPTEQELMVDTTRCNQPGCNAKMNSASNLTMHLVKHHRLSSLSLGKKYSHYGCPIAGCKYFIKSKKFNPRTNICLFKSLKLLKQHFNKCHAAKKFKCDKCPKEFAKKYLLNAHSKSCGKKFVCSCGWFYNTIEALQTHCKRKFHQPAGVDSENIVVRIKSSERKKKSSNDSKNLVQVVIKRENKEEMSSGQETENLLEVHIKSTTNVEKNSDEMISLHYVAAMALSELSTRLIPKLRHTSVQTNEVKLSQSDKRAATTQTQEAAGCFKCDTYKKNRWRSAETQTNLFLFDSDSDSSDSVAKSKSPALNDYSIWKPDSGSDSQLCNNETQTIGSLFEIEGVSSAETQTIVFTAETEGMSSAETQTTDDLFDDFYAHMCTQTSDLFDFDTIDNQTQTAWPDI